MQPSFNEVTNNFTKVNRDDVKRFVNGSTKSSIISSKILDRIVNEDVLNLMGLTEGPSGTW